MASTAPTKEPKTALQEDDEFEDFPVEDWPAEQDLSASTSGEAGATTGQTGQQPGQPSASAHLWEESWDDDDASGAGEDFAAALRGEMGK